MVGAWWTRGGRFGLFSIYAPLLASQNLHAIMMLSCLLGPRHRLKRGIRGVR